VANILWALTRSQPRHPATHATVLALLPRCTARMQQFKPQELASVALAAAKCVGISGKLGHPGPLHPEIMDFFSAALPWVAARLPNFSGQSLANITTSFLVVRIGDAASIFDAVAHQVIGRAKSLENSALLLLLRNLPAAPSSSACTVAVRALFAEAAGRLDSGAFGAKEHAVLSRIFSCMKGQERGTAHSREDLRAFCDEMANEAVDVGWEMDPSVQDVDLDCGRCSGDDSRTATAATGTTRGGTPARQSGGASAVPLRVADVADRSSRKAVDRSSSPRLVTPSRRLLPPPLDIMPQWVSTEKLNAYRADYQEYRVGNSIGAKGEISKSVARDEVATLAMKFSPPLDFIPRDISPHKLQEFRQEYRRFRAGESRGAKGELSSVIARSEPCFISLDKLAVCGPMATSDSEPSSVRPDALDDVLDKAWGGLGVHFDMAVKNTFLHFKDDDMEYNCDTRLLTPLPPPLPIIPSSVPAMKLEAYRADYQRFRAGECRGAKGEVSSSVI